LFFGSWVQRQDKLWVFSVLWLAIYGIFFWTWEPATECYRMTDVVPLAILMALGLPFWRTVSNQRIFLGILFLAPLTLNLTTRILPMHDASQNAVYQEITTLTTNTPEE